MEAKVNQQNGVYTVALKGQLDFESADALKQQCQRYFVEQNVIFDLCELSFVGSSGITPFLEMLGSLLRQNGTALKVCSAGTEFIRVFEAGGLNGLEVYENEKQARMAFEYHLEQLRNQARMAAESEQGSVEAAIDRLTSGMGLPGKDI